jgi:hypothetical protein
LYQYTKCALSLALREVPSANKIDAGVVATADAIKA